MVKELKVTGTIRTAATLRGSTSQTQQTITGSVTPKQSVSGTVTTKQAITGRMSQAATATFPVVVDQELSDTSRHPVENRVVTKALGTKTNDDDVSIASPLDISKLF